MIFTVSLYFSTLNINDTVLYIVDRQQEAFLNYICINILFDAKKNMRKP